MSPDLAWLLISYLYVAAVLVTGTLAARVRRSPDLTRKIIHVGVGTWIIPTAVFFESPWMAMIPPVSFILLNLASYRFKLVKAMEGEEANPGTIYFPLAFVILMLAYWPGALFRSGLPWAPHGPAGPGRFPVAAGIMVMAWGDAAASIFGRRFGRHRWPVAGGQRSLEGSLAFLVFGVLGVMAADHFLAGGGTFPLPEAWPAGATLRAVAVVMPAVLVEAVSPRGLDNLTVPLLCGTLAALGPGRP